jgi:hypothetical protein
MWRHPAAKVGMSEGRGKQWQTTPKSAMCQSHTGHLTGLWFLPKPAQGLNTNQSISTKGGRTNLLSLFVVAIFETIYIHMYTHTHTHRLREGLKMGVLRSGGYLVLRERERERERERGSNRRERMSHNEMWYVLHTKQ